MYLVFTPSMKQSLLFTQKFEDYAIGFCIE